MQLYMSWYIISFFRLYLYFLNIVPFFSSTPVLTFSIEVVFILSILLQNKPFGGKMVAAWNCTRQRHAQWRGRFHLSWRNQPVTWSSRQFYKYLPNSTQHTISMETNLASGPIISSQIAKFMGPAWGPPGSCRPPDGPRVGPMNLAIRNTILEHYVPCNDAISPLRVLFTNISILILST